jgi:hypothetical protein
MRWAEHGRNLHKVLVREVEGIAYFVDVGVDGCIKMDLKGIERGFMEIELRCILCTILNRHIP